MSWTHELVAVPLSAGAGMTVLAAQPVWEAATAVELSGPVMVTAAAVVVALGRWAIDEVKHRRELRELQQQRELRQAREGLDCGVCDGSGYLPRSPSGAACPDCNDQVVRAQRGEGGWDE